MLSKGREDGIKSSTSLCLSIVKFCIQEIPTHFAGYYICGREEMLSAFHVFFSQCCVGGDARL